MSPDEVIDGIVYIANVRLKNKWGSQHTITMLAHKGDGPIGFNEVKDVVEIDNRKSFYAPRVDNLLTDRTSFKFSELKTLLGQQNERMPGKPKLLDDKVYTFLEFLVEGYRYGKLTNTAAWERLRTLDQSLPTLDKLNAGSQITPADKTDSEKRVEQILSLTPGDHQLISGAPPPTTDEQRQVYSDATQSTSKPNADISDPTREERPHGQVPLSLHEEVVTSAEVDNENSEETLASGDGSDGEVPDVMSVEDLESAFQAIHLEIVPSGPDSVYKEAFILQKAHYFDLFKKFKAQLVKARADNLALMQDLDLEKQKLRTYNAAAAENIVEGMTPTLKSYLGQMVNISAKQEGSDAISVVVRKLDDLSESLRTRTEINAKGNAEVLHFLQSTGLMPPDESAGNSVNVAAILLDIHKRVVGEDAAPFQLDQSSSGVITPEGTPLKREASGESVGQPPCKVLNFCSLPAPSAEALANVSGLIKQSQLPLVASHQQPTPPTITGHQL